MRRQEAVILTTQDLEKIGRPTLEHYNRAHSGGEAWQQDFLKLDLPDRHFDGVFANAALFHVPSQELPRVLLELHALSKPLWGDE